MKSPQASANRFDALDTLRCLAVLFMVQGHLFTLVIEDAVRGEMWYRWHNYLHGFTAPAFLLGAGLAFGVTTLHNLEPHLGWSPALRRRLYRYASLLAIGYALQLPPLGREAAALSHGQLVRFARVEALQHIGMVMLVCQGLVLLLRDRLRIALAAAALGAIVVLLGPWLSRQPLDEALPLGVAAYLSSKAGSTFPLIPWSGFVFFGVAAAGAVSRDTMFRPSPKLALGLPAIGLLLVGASLLLDRTAPGAFGEHNYWKVSPYFFLRRLGWLGVLLGGFVVADLAIRRVARGGAPGKLRHWVRVISQSSLVLYVAHLMILFGSPFGPGVKHHAEHSLSPAQGSALLAAVFAMLAALLYVWRKLELGFPTSFARVRQTTVATLAAVVLIGVFQINWPQPIEPPSRVPLTAGLPSGP